MQKTCPYCGEKYEEGNFTCPHCKKRLPSNANQNITGHASLGDMDAYLKKAEQSQSKQSILSEEDKDMLRDNNHATSGDDDIDCAQPYSFVEHDHGDRN